MPKIDVVKVPALPTDFSGALGELLGGRTRAKLGDAAGLTQFGVNLCRVEPGARSSLNHWHENEDEFVFVLAGDVVLVEGGIETPLGPGDAAGFKAGTGVGHHIENRGAEEAVMLEVGTRAIGDRCHYPGHDLIVEIVNGTDRLLHRDGKPYSDATAKPVD
ncbi:putative cupin superfamily protein [Rhodobium orientis]|uniref:Cupin type-2 domain-containing protein n=1 Tax=Rhodobium orientis TaxID=34017 RepID=A0A327JPS4_9HYPH|nr:cupin domain-containing protein [Rhodobium orientis]MBB4304865.1 putative cupin superfamily protein [Rhodobium orientis]MBK5949194.1 hypothetical protein [Rhodobium orientis]RAI27363.1 hypothetical protein CH339_10520 [Rhodobium orientis]